MHTLGIPYLLVMKEIVADDHGNRYPEQIQAAGINILSDAAQ
jgi:hypothetical protein